MESVLEKSVFIPNPARETRSYLKGIVIEPGLALNETAAEFFKRLNGEKSVAEVVTEVSEIYNIDYKTCLQDCIELVQELVEEQILIKGGHLPT